MHLSSSSNSFSPVLDYHFIICVAQTCLPHSYHLNLFLDLLQNFFPQSPRQPHQPRCRAADHGLGSLVRRGSLRSKSATLYQSCRTSSPKLAFRAMLECHLRGCCRKHATTSGACTRRWTT